MDEKDIKTIKDLKDAKDDLNKMDEILNDTNKFRAHSNKVYHEIADKIEYLPFIAVERAKYKLHYGDIPFENVTNYWARRKIITMLRQAVLAYIEVETGKKVTEDK
ncbi:MAG: hypothetical protein II896_03355 [Clostridia bacterium]|nr:hypothetical protein [Clostridia bacterium]